MSHRKTAAGPCLALILAVAMLLAADILTGCSDAKQLRVIGDPCERHDHCESTVCDEFVCKPCEQFECKPASPYAAAVLADKPIAYWRFGDSTTPRAFDFSGNGYHGVYVVVNVSQPGAILNDPNTSVQITASNDSEVGEFGGAFGFVGHQPFSAELWFKPTQPHACLLGQVDWDATAEKYKGWFLYYKSTEITLRRSGTNVNAFVTVSTSEWTHVVATFDGVTAAMFVNGTQIVQRASRNPVAAISEPFLIGRMDNWQDYEGLIDEVALYEHALTPGRVLAHFKAGSGT